MWTSWREASERALYGDAGFYRRVRPSAHYRTSVGASSRYAGALVTVLREVDAALGHPSTLDVVDVGAGSGRLLAELLRQCPPGLRPRLTAVELGPRPDGLAPEISWTSEPPESITGLVVANEWLDNVPVDVVEQTTTGPRLVQVELDTGVERLGNRPGADDLVWLDRWWPLERAGERAELGRPRDQAWAGVVRRIARGVAIAADYDHRLDARPLYGTLTGFRDGRAVPPVPDGSCDITAHVALDACAAAGVTAGATGTVLTTQRDALRALGVRARRPPLDLAHRDPRGYLQALRRAGEEGELIDRSGLGGFGWLVQSVATPLPPDLAALVVPAERVQADGLADP